MRTRLHVDRLLLDGLPADTTPAAIERALRAALAAGVAGVGPAKPATMPALRLQGKAAGVETAAGDVARAVAGLAGGRR